MSTKSKVTSAILFLVFYGCLYIIFTAQYIISEFFTKSNPNVNVLSSTNHIQCNKIKKEAIPNVLHQIYAFKDPFLLEDHRLKREKWISMHPNFTHILWSAGDVLELIRKEYPQLYWIYKSYGHWIQRSDVARYVILYHYGGWYVDLDVTCKKNVQTLTKEAWDSNQRVVLHETFPAGPSNDFIGITPRHPFLRSLLDALPQSNRWFVFPHANIMLTTGPTFLWGRLINYPCPEEVEVLERAKFNQYIYIKHDGSWHGWDEAIITFFVTYTKSCVLIIFCVLCVTVGLVLRAKRSRLSLFDDLLTISNKVLKRSTV